jgi:hypothetical protein
MFRRRQQSDSEPERAPVLSLDATAALRVEGPGAENATCTELTEVWYVALRTRRKPAFDPYFIARCECEWLSKPHDAQDPAAFEEVCAEALGHSNCVAFEVARPLA